MIRVYDEAGNLSETHTHKGRFQGVVTNFDSTGSSSKIAQNPSL
jgi:hypothetical protein